MPWLGQPVAIGELACPLLDVDVLRAIATLQPLDQLGDVDVLVGLAHARRYVHSDHAAYHDGLDGLATAMRTHHLDGHGHDPSTVPGSGLQRQHCARSGYAPAAWRRASSSWSTSRNS